MVVKPVNPRTYMEVTHSVERKEVKAIHMLHKITNSAKIEAIHTIKLQVQQNLKMKTTDSANNFINFVLITVLQ